MTLSATACVMRLLAAAALLTPGLAPRALAADESMPPYDPALCHQDAKGKRYIAEGVAVFAIDPDPTIFGGSMPLRFDRLTPPDLSDKVGCPSNPRQFGYFMTPLDAVFPRPGRRKPRPGCNLSALG